MKKSLGNWIDCSDSGRSEVLYRRGSFEMKRFGRTGMQLNHFVLSSPLTGLDSAESGHNLHQSGNGIK